MKFVENYIADLRQILAGVDPESIEKAIFEVQAAGERGNFIYACGNGGSAAVASQMVVDLIKSASLERPKRFKMLGLTDNVFTVTAYSNDISYDVVFEEQLKNFAQEGDVLIAISGSGNSINVIKAVEYAKSVGCRTIGLTTSEGGQLKDVVDLPVLVPSPHMGRLEDSFFIITHIILYAFIEKEY